jgi:HPt (histidine-containing phosphotransfer) domain-containing protein
MTSSRVLLVEEDPARAKRIADALSAANFEAFYTINGDLAQEALAVRQFDFILISSQNGFPNLLDQVEPMARRLCPSAMLIGYGVFKSNACDAVISDSVPETELASALARARQNASVDQERIADQLTAFELPAFRQQMGDDPELMKEIIGIFFEESVQQLRDLHQAIEAHEYHRASRLAHSLKGSLGSLHAPRARHWAQALETAATSGDSGRSERYLSALEQSIRALTPQLQQVFTE